MKHVYVYKNTLLISDRSVNIIYDVLNISEVDSIKINMRQFYSKR